MTDTPFERLFHSEDPARDAFRSRLFGLFSEEIVRHWAANKHSPYRDLGRPTLWSGTDYATVDFTLQSRSDGRVYVAELKSEMAWSGYRYLRLIEPAQVARHGSKRAFAWLLDTARDPTSHIVRVRAKPVHVSGAILVWGATTPEGKRSSMTTFGFADVLSVEAMLDDLRTWTDAAWAKRVEELRSWSNGLYDGLQ